MEWPGFLYTFLGLFQFESTPLLPTSIKDSIKEGISTFLNSITLTFFSGKIKGFIPFPSYIYLRLTPKRGTEKFSPSTNASTFNRDGKYYEIVKANYERADRTTVVRTATNCCVSIVYLLSHYKDLIFN